MSAIDEKKKLATEAANQKPAEDDIPDVPSPEAQDAEEYGHIVRGGTGERTKLEQKENSNLAAFGYKNVYLHLSLSFAMKMPLLIYGDPGVGKSEIVKQFAQDVAAGREKYGLEENEKAGKGREYIEWTTSSPDVRKNVLANPEKYFILIDIRAVQIEPSDVTGIPDLHATEPYLKMRQNVLIHLMSRPNSAGILFLDELNQAHEQTMKALFEVILDRAFAGTKISEHWGIFAAGNLGDEFGNTPLPVALTNRFKAGILVADPAQWLVYAKSAKVNSAILDFVAADPKDNFYVKPTNSGDAYPTPRAILRFSREYDRLKRMYVDAGKSGKSIPHNFYSHVEETGALYCGAKWATNFVHYLEHMKSFTWPGVVKDADQIKKYDHTKRFAAYTFTVRTLRWALSNSVRNTPQGKKVLGEVIHILNSIDPEQTAIVLNRIRYDYPEAFTTFIVFALKGDYDPTYKKVFNERWAKEIGPIVNGEQAPSSAKKK